MGRSFKRIALVRLGALGDIVHALPVAHRLRRELPQAYIAWVVEAEHSPLLEGHAGIDELIVLNTKSWRRGVISKPWREIGEAIRQLRAANFDLVLDLQGLIKSGVVTCITGAKHRLGFSQRYCRESASAWLTNEHISPDKIHIIEQNLAFIKHLGLKTAPWEFDLPSSAADIDYINSFLSRQGLGTSPGLIGINPGAGWITKRWGAENYAQLGDRLIEPLGQGVVLTWGPGEHGLAEEIAQRMRCAPLIACPTTITQLIELMRRCRLFIAGDSGPLHMAAALGVPCVALYGPTNPARNGPYGEIHRTVYHQLDCSGCYKRQCPKLRCLELIDVEEVFVAACELLSQPLKTEVTN